MTGGILVSRGIEIQGRDQAMSDQVWGEGEGMAWGDGVRGQGWLDGTGDGEGWGFKARTVWEIDSTDKRDSSFSVYHTKE